jgi:hypothetical protein
MPTFDPLRKARELAEQATQAALEARGQAATRAAEIRDKTTARAEDALGRAAEVRDQAAAKIGDFKELLVGKIVDIKDAALSAVKELVDDLNEHIPALREAGYTLTEVSVDVGLMPKIVASFASAPDISQERIDAVIEEHKEATVTIAMLRALYAAYKLQKSVHLVGMRPRAIALEIGIAPGVVVKFA